MSQFILLIAVEALDTLPVDGGATPPADGVASSYADMRCRWCSVSYVIWRRNVLYFATALGGLAFAILCSITLVGLVEEINYLWIGSLPFVAVLALAAFVSAAFACRDAYQHERGLPR